MTAPMVLDGPMTAAWFLAYVERMLIPTLAPGGFKADDAAVVRDNARTLKFRPEGTGFAEE